VKGKKIHVKNKISIDKLINESKCGDVLLFYSFAPMFITPIFFNFIFTHIAVVIDNDKICDTEFGSFSKILDLRNTIEEYHGTVFYCKRKDEFEYEKVSIECGKRYPSVIEQIIDFILDKNINNTENCIEQTLFLLTGKRCGTRTSAREIKKILKQFYDKPKRIIVD
jgi:hypothetical protein